MKFLSALSLKSFATVLAAVSVAHAAGDQEAIAPDNSAVVKLSADSFSSFLTENPLVLAEFFAPWCGHCKALGPNFAKAAEVLEPKDIKLAQIDCTENQQLCQDQGIKGYPTMKIFRGKDSDPADYEGPRSADGIVSYMIKQSLPAVSVIEDKADLDDFISESESAVVVETGSKLNETFYQLANLNRDEYSFIQTNSKDYTKKYGADKILVFVPGSDEPAVYKGDGTFEELVEFLSIESVPYFGELDGTTYQKYASANVPLAYLFYTSPEEKKAYEKTIVKLAKANRGDVNFVGIDASKFGRHATNLNIQEKFPAFVIHDPASNKKYAVSQDSDLTTKAVENFIKEYKDGKVEPIVKTEDVPEVQENAVYKIVGKTHDEIVGDETRDVLVKYYAPWCGHCKRLAPTFEELAQLYASDDDASDKVRIANVDATLNDVDVDLTGYPTLILYPAGDKSNPIVHTGGRDLQSMINFIKEKGTHGIDATEFEVAEPAAEEEEAEAEKASSENAHDEL